MSFKPFTAMAKKVPEDTQEMVLAVGAVALVWAHVELGLDMLIGLIDNLPNTPKRKRHPVPLSAKLSAIFVAMRDQPALLPYRGELLQIHSLTATLGEKRHAILHGAALSMLEDSKFKAFRLVNGDDEATIEHEQVSLHTAFILFEGSFELTFHIYNLLFALFEKHFPGALGELEKLRVDTAKFKWPAINPMFYEKKDRDAEPRA